MSQRRHTELGDKIEIKREGKRRRESVRDKTRGREGETRTERRREKPGREGQTYSD